VFSLTYLSPLTLTVPSFVACDFKNRLPWWAHYSLSLSQAKSSFLVIRLCHCLVNPLSFILERLNYRVLLSIVSSHTEFTRYKSLLHLPLKLLLALGVVTITMSDTTRDDTWPPCDASKIGGGWVLPKCCTVLLCIQSAGRPAHGGMDTLRVAVDIAGKVRSTCAPAQDVFPVKRGSWKF